MLATSMTSLTGTLAIGVVPSLTPTLAIESVLPLQARYNNNGASATVPMPSLTVR